MLTTLVAALLTFGDVNDPAVIEAAKVMEMPGLVVTFEVIPCLEINAGYSPLARTIYICRELLDYLPAPAIRAVIAHEMSHAIIHQYHVPVTGSEEAAADELAAVKMSLAGYQMDILQTAIWFQEMANAPGYKDDVRDPHPALARRGWMMACLEDGSEEIPNDVGCAALFFRARHNWERLLKLHEVAE